MRDGDKGWGWLAGVLLAAAAVRLLAATVLVPAWEAGARRAAFPDHYPTLAVSLAEKGTLGFQTGGAPITTARGPGFPAWLALPVLCGLRGDRVLAWWATVPGLLGAALAAWAGLRFGPRHLPSIVAPAAAALAGLHPLPIFASARGMADEFCGVLGLAGLVAWRQAETSARRPLLWATVSGLALGAAMLTRATALLFLAALLAAALLSRASWRRALLVACVALVPALAWSVRSSRLEGRPVFVHSLAAYNFWLGEAQDRLGLASDDGSLRARAIPLMAREGVAPADAAALWYTQGPEQTARLETKLGHAAVRRIVDDPLGYAARVARGLVRFWVAGDSPSTTRAYAAVVLPFLALVLAGALGSREGRRDPLLRAVLLATALHAVFYAAVFPMARYSVAVYPGCALVAARGLGLFYGSGWRSGRGSPPP